MLIHVEVQAQRDHTFARRMAVYNCRIFDRYDCDVVSLAVLADDDPDWRPRRKRRGQGGCTVGMTFPPAKLLDYAGREAELEASDNPFAKVVLAHLKTIQTRDDPQDRRIWKARIARGLYECGFPAEDVHELMKLIDWLMQLPDALEREYQQELEAYEEGRHMPFLGRFELRSIHGLLGEALSAKFGEEGMGLMPTISSLRDAEKYKSMMRVIATATTLDEVREACAVAAAPEPEPEPDKKRGRTRRPKSPE